MSKEYANSCISSIDRGVPTRRAFFGEGRGPVHLSRAECTSRDSILLNCTIDKTGANGYNHSEDAGVICSGTYVCNLMLFLCVGRYDHECLVANIYGQSAG